MNKNSLTKEEVELGVQQLDKSIAAMKSELSKLQRARDFLAGQNGQIASRASNERLPKVLPEKLVHEAMKEYRKLTIGGVRQKVKQDRGYDIRDSSARRGLQKLIIQGVVWLDDDGYYNYREALSPKDEYKPVSESISDENPF